jgi:hypothetical protein
VLVLQNGVILSAVEHPKYWTPAKPEAFIEALMPLIGQATAQSGSTEPSGPPGP